MSTSSTSSSFSSPSKSLAVFRASPAFPSASSSSPPNISSAPLQPRVEVRSSVKPIASSGELVVRVAYGAIQPGDLMWLSGIMKMPKEMKEPYAGVSAAGVVESAGDESLKDYVGKPVMMYRALNIQPNNIGLWSEYALIVPSQCAIIPNAVIQSAQLAHSHPNSLSALQDFSGSLVNIFTSFSFLHECVLPLSGVGIVITAGVSATGRSLIALAAQFGVRTVSIVRNGEEAESLRKLQLTLPSKPKEGSDYYIVCSDSKTFSPETVAAITAANASVVFDCITGQTLSTILPLLLGDSKIYLYSVLDRSPLLFPAMLIMQKRLSLQSFSVFRCSTITTADGLQKALKEITTILERTAGSRHWWTNVGKVYAKKNAEEAVKEAAEKYHSSRILLDFTH